MSDVSGVYLSTLIHDLEKKRSFVTMVWEDDPTKRITLTMPFGVGLDELRDQADAALKALARKWRGWR